MTRKSIATTSKDNRNGEAQAGPVQPQPEETSVKNGPNDDEIRVRAYEIYLERGSLPGNAIDDWLRAERELQRVALFKRAWNRLEQRRGPDSQNGN